MLVPFPISQKYLKYQFLPNSSFMKFNLPKSLAGFRKRNITQYALLKTIGTWNYMLNKGNKVGAFVIDFSAATLCRW